MLPLPSSGRGDVKLKLGQLRDVEPLRIARVAQEAFARQTTSLQPCPSTPQPDPTLLPHNSPTTLPYYLTALP